MTRPSPDSVMSDVRKLFTELATPGGEPPMGSFATRFWAGYATLFAATLFTHPLDTLRVRISVTQGEARVVDVASKMYAQGGIRALYGGFDMEQGTQGFMTGFAFPEVLNAMNNAAQAGDLAAAHALYQRFLPLMVFEQQPGVAVRKELYRIRGLIESNTVRHPANAIAPALATALQAELARALPGVDLKQPLPAELFAGR